MEGHLVRACWYFERIMCMYLHTPHTLPTILCRLPLVRLMWWV